MLNTQLFFTAFGQKHTLINFHNRGLSHKFTYTRKNFTHFYLESNIQRSLSVYIFNTTAKVLKLLKCLWALLKGLLENLRDIPKAANTYILYQSGD